MFGMVKFLRGLLDTKLDRLQVRLRSDYAEAIESQIKEQLQQHQEKRDRENFAAGYRAGVASAEASRGKWESGNSIKNGDSIRGQDGQLFIMFTQEYLDEQQSSIGAAQSDT